MDDSASRQNNKESHDKESCKQESHEESYDSCVRGGLSVECATLHPAKDAPCSVQCMHYLVATLLAERHPVLFSNAGFLSSFLPSKERALLTNEAFSPKETPPFEKEGAPLSLGVVFVDNAYSQKANHTLRGIDKPTNVISVDYGGHQGLEWELIFACEVVQAESEAAAYPLKDYWAHLIVHGLCHLLGYTHENDRDESLMKTKEAQILTSLSIPYLFNPL